ncbi:hypothetical protein [Streptomyces shenzhenensis]|uniref:hypothetical protein n=1 Tax=Streptomyces shenzhenensis TaxID=943815 RepID=UPI001F441453|nr:hypothetical protein [Streptomyces shenzhenensis]
MRSARMILATTAATAVLAFSAPVAQAAVAADGGRDDSSYNSNTNSNSNSKFDPETYKGQDDQGGKGDQGGKQDQGGKGKDEGGSSWGDDEESDRPHGGMHTGGGGLATPGVTAGGLAVLGVAATGAYALRRRRVTGPVS